MAQETQVESGTADESASAEQTSQAAASAANVTSESGVSGSSASSTQASPEQLKLEQLEKSYKELQSFSTRTSQERSELRKKLEGFEAMQKQLASAIEKLSEKPYDPDTFMDDLRAQGPKVLESLFEKKLRAMEESRTQESASYREQIENLQTDLAILHRRADPKNYPNFSELESEMAKAAHDPTLPLDRKLPIPEFIDALYNYVRLQHSKDALTAAEKLGAEKAKQQLANESATTVVGGGKATNVSTPDLARMPFDKLEKFLEQSVGVAER